MHLYPNYAYNNKYLNYLVTYIDNKSNCKWMWWRRSWILS